MPCFVAFDSVALSRVASASAWLAVGVVWLVSGFVLLFYPLGFGSNGHDTITTLHAGGRAALFDTFAGRTRVSSTLYHHAACPRFSSTLSGSTQLFATIQTWSYDGFAGVAIGPHSRFIRHHNTLCNAIFNFLACMVCSWPARCFRCCQS